MAKKTDVLDSAAKEQIKVPAVEKLEEISKVGFFAQVAEDPDHAHLLPEVRLCCETEDLENPIILTPFMPINVLSDMIQGAIYLQPLLIKTIKERQKNAEAPQE